MPQIRHQLVCVALAWIGIWVTGSSACAQAEVADAPTLWSEPILRRQFALAISGLPTDASEDAGRGARIRLFRMPTGFLSDPVGLDLDDGTMGAAADGENALTGGGPWGLTLGTDNPYFDFRLPGDPGGVGYYRANTQYQLYESASTHVSFNLEAATPAGLETPGVTGGPTILTPAMAYFQEMESGAAVQAFVGKHIGARPGWSDGLERSVHYGVALEQPLFSGPADSGKNVYMFLEALGHSRLVTYTGQSPAPCWRLLPGVHWRVTENCWMSGGVLVPLNNTHVDPGLVQFTCSWRY
jgi:hypothetical protein